jgi:hypothetical protein
MKKVSTAKSSVSSMRRVDHDGAVSYIVQNHGGYGILRFLGGQKDRAQSMVSAASFNPALTMTSTGESKVAKGSCL